MKAAKLKNELIWDWMRPELATVEPDSTLKEAVSRMKKHGIHHLVVMKGNRLLGLLDARDCAGSWDPNGVVQDIMRVHVPVIDENSEIREVVRLMLHHQLTGLPLKRKDEICGIITVSDLLQLLSIQIRPEGQFAEWVKRGKDLLAEPIVQSLVNILGVSGI